MNDDILDCPFCGQEVKGNQDVNNFYSIACKNIKCDVSVHILVYGSKAKEKCIGKWNERA